MLREIANYDVNLKDLKLHLKKIKKLGYMAKNYPLLYYNIDIAII